MPKVKHAVIKKTNRQKKTFPLLDFSRPLQTPKNQEPFFALIMLDIFFQLKVIINNLSAILFFTSIYFIILNNLILKISSASIASLKV